LGAIVDILSTVLLPSAIMAGAPFEALRCPTGDLATIDAASRRPYFLEMF
jgi:hypothetical protein